MNLTWNTKIKNRSGRIGWSAALVENIYSTEGLLFQFLTYYYSNTFQWWNMCFLIHYTYLIAVITLQLKTLDLHTKHVITSLDMLCHYSLILYKEAEMNSDSNSNNNKMLVICSCIEIIIQQHNIYYKKTHCKAAFCIISTVSAFFW